MSKSRQTAIEPTETEGHRAPKKIANEILQDRVQLQVRERALQEAQAKYDQIVEQKRTERLPGGAESLGTMIVAREERDAAAELLRAARDRLTRLDAELRAAVASGFTDVRATQLKEEWKKISEEKIPALHLEIAGKVAELAGLVDRLRGADNVIGLTAPSPQNIVATLALAVAFNRIPPPMVFCKAIRSRSLLDVRPAGCEEDPASVRLFAPTQFHRKPGERSLAARIFEINSELTEIRDNLEPAVNARIAELLAGGSAAG